MIKILMMHVIFLSRLLGIHLSFRKPLLFLDIQFLILAHSIVDLIMPLSDHDINSYPYYACYAQPDFASPRDNTDVVQLISDLSFPLAKCTGLGKGDPFRFDARFDVSDACFKSEDIFDKLHDLG